VAQRGSVTLAVTVVFYVCLPNSTLQLVNCPSTNGPNFKLKLYAPWYVEDEMKIKTEE
jgi:hypothetical protein